MQTASSNEFFTETSQRFSKPPPLALYVHYPWCAKKCPYCDFNSHASAPDDNYVDALLDDLDADLAWISKRPLVSIFVGGGTPSLMSSAELEKLLLGIRQRFDFCADIEITLEVNPESADEQKLADFRALGVNRVSIGVQSFDDQNLKNLGRAHNRADIFKTIAAAQDANFDAINLDLMFGLENQTLAAARRDVSEAIHQQPTHISFYQLTIEPNTYFAKYPPHLPSDETIWKIGRAGASMLEAGGFSQYEVSAFGARPSRHNLNYWRFGDYLGVGAGACGKITAADGTMYRTMKPKSPKDYLRKNQLSRRTKIENPRFEFMLNALRLKNGFDKKLFAERTGIPLFSIREKLSRAQNAGLLEIDDSRIRPSVKGFDFLNDLQMIFL